MHPILFARDPLAVSTEDIAMKGKSNQKNKGMVENNEAGLRCHARAEPVVSCGVQPVGVNDAGWTRPLSS